MAGTVSFKVYLYDEEDSAKSEVRRFGVDSDVVTNFLYLREKVQNIFPSIRGRRFTITWKDIDGDDVVISSDEELQIALAETASHPVRKLYLILHSEYTSAASNEASDSNETLHVGVTCDGCEKAVKGFRFKCIQCADYDLCSTCQAQGLHKEHCMLRLVSPIQWRPHYGKRLAHHMNKFVKKSSIDKEEEPKHEGHGKDSRHHGRGHHGRGHHGPRRCPIGEGGASWIDTFASYLNDWANLPGECPMSQKSPAADKSKDQESTPNQSKAEEGKKNASNDLDVHVELLKKVGQNLAQFLDPLGIDIDFQVKNSATEPPATSSKSNDNAKTETTTPSPAPEVATPKSGQQTAKETSETPNSDAVSSSSEKVVDSEDWTIIGSNSGASPTGTIPKKVVPSAPEESPSLPAKPMYPELPKAEPTIYHSNPKIQKAVEAMIQMGFTNEGGWLTNLLEAKDGDIVRALDALHRN